MPVFLSLTRFLAHGWHGVGVQKYLRNKTFLASDHSLVPPHCGGGIMGRSVESLGGMEVQTQT